MSRPALIEGRLPDERFPVTDLKGFLRGAWNLDRTIDDGEAGVRGTFNGTASFEHRVAGLRYRERGILDMPGHVGEAVRAYHYAFPAPGIAEVRFEDGDFFHDLDLTDGAWSAVHPCGADRYHGRFTAEGPDRWRVEWQVTGPGKTLVLDSRYRRKGSAHANVRE